MSDNKKIAPQVARVQAVLPDGKYTVVLKNRLITVRSAMMGTTIFAGTKVLVSKADDGRLYITSAEGVKTARAVKEVSIS